MSDIRPSMRVRVTRGMYQDGEAVVVALHNSDDGPYATLDVGRGYYIGVLLSALEPIAETPTLRDRVTVVLEAARAQRDREADLAETRGEEACCHEYAHALLEETIAALTQALGEGS